MSLQTYRDLEAWKKSIDLVQSVYEITQHFPSEERFGLTNQMRRAAVSIPSNIAEGYGRIHRGDYLHHLSIARGSLLEVETQLIISDRLQYIARDENKAVWNQTQEIGKILNGLIASLKAKTQNPEP